MGNWDGVSMVVRARVENRQTPDSARLSVVQAAEQAWPQWWWMTDLGEVRVARFDEKMDEALAEEAGVPRVEGEVVYRRKDAVGCLMIGGPCSEVEAKREALGRWSRRFSPT